MTWTIVEYSYLEISRLSINNLLSEMKKTKAQRGKVPRRVQPQCTIA